MIRTFSSVILVLALLITACGSKEQTAEVSPTHYLVLLTKGVSYGAEATPDVQELQQQHMDNIRRLADSGVLVLAGPFINEKPESDLLGIFVFDVDSLAEAEALTSTDPAVKAGRLGMDVYGWRGAPEVVYDEPVEMWCSRQ